MREFDIEVDALVIGVGGGGLAAAVFDQRIHDIAGISGRSGGVVHSSRSGLLHVLGLGGIAGRAAAAEMRLRANE